MITFHLAAVVVAALGAAAAFFGPRLRAVTLTGAVVSITGSAVAVVAALTAGDQVAALISGALGGTAGALLVSATRHYARTEAGTGEGR